MSKGTWNTKEVFVIKETAICKLTLPATCEYRIDGKLSFTALCGGNNLSKDVKQCPYRALAEIMELAQHIPKQQQERHCVHIFDVYNHGEVECRICKERFQLGWALDAQQPGVRT